MNNDCRAVNRRIITLILILCLLVFMGLLLVENALFEYGNMPNSSPFPRFQLPAPGEYRLHYRGREMDLSRSITVGMLQQDERGLWLQAWGTKFYCPTTIALFPLPWI